jgi:hypothetical protein
VRERLNNHGKPLQRSFCATEDVSFKVIVGGGGDDGVGDGGGGVVWWWW